jgi:site-specific recombinase XerC
MEHLLAAWSGGHANNQYRALQQLFKWLAEEEEISVNPMARLRPPKVEEKLVPVLTDEQIRALLRTCPGKDLVDRRDQAILRIFLSTGIRLAEMAGLRLDDVDLDARTAIVTGKGRRERSVRFDPKRLSHWTATFAFARVTAGRTTRSSGSGRRTAAPWVSRGSTRWCSGVASRRESRDCIRTSSGTRSVIGISTTVEPKGI